MHMLDHIEINILKICIWAPREDKFQGITKRKKKIIGRGLSRSAVNASSYNVGCHDDGDADAGKVVVVVVAKVVAVAVTMVVVWGLTKRNLKKIKQYLE